MHFLDLTLSSAAENLALDEALLLSAESTGGPELLRLWEWQAPAVVLGSGSRLLEDVDEPTCRLDQVPILRRASGGGTVLLGSGCLCFSLVLAYERSFALGSIRSSYEFVLGRIRHALLDLVPACELAGTSDLAFGGRKFSGNSQQRKQKYLLHHGTLLYRFDLAQVSRYLHLPSRLPAYRDSREHATFLTNLAVDGHDLKDRLRGAWDIDGTKSALPLDLVCDLVASKYGMEEWTRRR